MDFDKNFLLKLKLMFSNPDELFNTVKKEIGIANAMIMLLSVSILITGLKIVFTSFLFSFMSSEFDIMPLYWSIGLLFGIPFILLSSFVYPFLIFIFLYLCKIRARYSETYKAFTYAMIPSIILSVIPIIGFLGFIYSFYLAIVGVAALNYREL